MKNELTNELLRNLLDQSGLVTRIDKEGDINTYLGADEDFPKDVVIFYLIRDGWLGIQAFSPDYQLDLGDDDKLRLANHLNSHTKLPKAYFRNGMLHFEHWVVIESNFSKEFMKKTLQNLTGYMWHAFVDLHKALNS